MLRYFEAVTVLLILLGCTHPDQTSPSFVSPSQNAIRNGLLWLARHQAADGHWSGTEFSAQCVGPHCTSLGEAWADVGLTGLSVLAFLGAGYSPRSTESLNDPLHNIRNRHCGEVVEKSLSWLVRQQSRDGLIGPRDLKYIYSHAIATLALCEALLQADVSLVREPAQRAVDFLVLAQNPHKGWRYSAKSGDNDSSVTAWCVLALWAAEMAGISFNAAAYDGALAWYAEVTEETGEGTGYVFKRDWGKVSAGTAPNLQFDYHPTMSACACLARYIIQRKREATNCIELDLLAQDPPEWKRNHIDYYYWFFGSAAMHLCGSPEAGRFKNWSESARAAVIPHQQQADCSRGSWDVVVDRWAFMGGGRVYATAINVLTLELMESNAGILKFKWER